MAVEKKIFKYLGGTSLYFWFIKKRQNEISSWVSRLEWQRDYKGSLMWRNGSYSAKKEDLGWRGHDFIFKHYWTVTSFVAEANSCFGEGNGNSFQYSCLRNTMHRSLVGYRPWGYQIFEHDLAAKQQQNLAVLLLQKSTWPTGSDHSQPVRVRRCCSYRACAAFRGSEWFLTMEIRRKFIRQ